MGTLIARAFELALMAIYFSLSSDAPPSPYYLVAIPFTTVQCVKQNKIDLAALFAHGDLVITKQRRKSNVDGKEE